MVQVDHNELVSKQHVFISGLARAGTTVLMRKFHATGLYRSLTYRDMPFVLAPNLWRRLSLISRREIENAERAHGDNLFVNIDSPESLDEVFWRVFVGDEYLQKTHLNSHVPSGEVLRKYVRYVNAILSAHTPRKELYLSKNNNNILRLGSIHQAFPNALILIPFREPLQHAFSLLRQHRRFSGLHEQNDFILSYMTWLGHHEFGLDHRPFLLGSTRLNPYSTETLDYWLQLWCRTYAWLENSKPKSALFICYEDLCAHEENWASLAELANIPVSRRISDPFKLSNRSIDNAVDQCLADHASTIYTRLVTQARDQLSW